MKTSLYKMPFQKRLTGNFGFAYPVVCKQLHPGTTWRQDVSALIRSQPMLAPAMGRISVTFATYFCPNRILNDDWENFITGGLDGAQTPVNPTVNSGAGFDPGSLGDFLNFPTGVANIDVSAYPFRCYGEVYNQYIRDEQLMPAVVVSKASGSDTTTSKDLKRAAWRRDYFTKARPRPQLGNPIAIPLLGDAPVVGNNTNFTVKIGSGSSNFVQATDSSGLPRLQMASTPAGTAAIRWGNESGLKADMSAVAGPSVE